MLYFTFSKKTLVKKSALSKEYLFFLLFVIFAIIVKKYNFLIFNFFQSNLNFLY